MPPDELVVDNLRCIFESGPVDVETKRKHTDWMNDYINAYLVERDFSDSKRLCAAAAIKGFYKANDSQLFGDFTTADSKIEPPASPLFPEDIRKVLKAMPVRTRAPLVIEWQSGIEINRVLGMKFPTDAAPQKVDLFGRKGHRRAYWSYIGADSVDLLKLVGESGFAAYPTVLKAFHKAAKRLGKEGLLKNPDMASWHPHALRHSFSTECSHAGVKPEVREFFMGHVAGIAWVYLHQEIHEADVMAEWRKVEPYVSLDYTEAALRDEYDERERNMLSELLELKRRVDLLSGGKSVGQSASEAPQALPGQR